MVYQLSALSVSFAYALAAMFAYAPSRAFGSYKFNLIKNIAITSILLALHISFGLALIPKELKQSWHWIVFSSVMGIFVGDGCLFLTMRLLGPRRMTLLFAMNSPMVFLLGLMLYHESYTRSQVLGLCISLVGVFIAVGVKKTSSAKAMEPNPNPKLWIYGVGLMAAFGQASGVLALKEVVLQGVNPITVTLWRVSFAAFSFLIFDAFRNGPRFFSKLFPPVKGENARHYIFIVVNSILGLGLGTSLINFALTGGNAGLVSTLSSLSPIFILPLLWLVTKQQPSSHAWLGACLTLIGIALVFLSP